MKRIGRAALLVLAVVSLLAAVAWSPLVEPLLVRFPTDLDQTIRYQGTFTVLADPATLAPLATPMTLPLKVERRLHVVSSSFRRVVVREDITAHIGDLPATTDYVSHEMDRRTMKLVDGPNSWAFDRSHVVPRRGTYRVTFPMNADIRSSYRFWANETDTVSPVVEDKPGRVDGLDVVWYSSPTDAPANDAYVASLVEKGFASPPSGARYEYWCRDNVAAEPRTGAVVSMRSTEGVRVRRADGAAQEVYRASFAQTPSSVASTVSYTRSQLRTLALVDRWLPLSLLVGGVLLLVLAGWMRARDRGVVVRPARRRPRPGGIVTPTA